MKKIISQHFIFGVIVLIIAGSATFATYKNAPAYSKATIEADAKLDGNPILSFGEGNPIPSFGAREICKPVAELLINYSNLPKNERLYHPDIVLQEKFAAAIFEKASAFAIPFDKLLIRNLYYKNLEEYLVYLQVGSQICKVIVLDSIWLINSEKINDSAI
jgi:hypothetical protein